jgi:hypothetical protein
MSTTKCLRGIVLEPVSIVGNLILFAISCPRVSPETTLLLHVSYCWMSKVRRISYLSRATIVSRVPLGLTITGVYT